MIQLWPNDTTARLRWIGWTTACGFLLLAGWLWRVQVYGHFNYTERLANQSQRTLRLPAPRGKILDIHGRPLAESRPSYTLVAYLEELRPMFREYWRRNRPPGKLTRAERTAAEIRLRHQALSQLVLSINPGAPFTLTERELQKHFTEQLALPLTVLEDLPASALAALSENSGPTRGLEIEVYARRVYASPSVSHIVGYLRRNDNPDEDDDSFYHYRLPDYSGEIGMERTYDEDLRGKHGSQTFIVNNLGYRKDVLVEVPAEPGSDISLTLDLDIQNTTLKSLQASGMKAGAAVVMDPNNGDLLAMASIPTYDLNHFYPKVDPVQWNLYREQRPTPLIFRATQERYAPGSIFKIISSLAILESGAAKTNDKLYNPGFFALGNRKIKDTAPIGEHDFRSAFKHSSNTYFIHYGLEAGVKNLIEMGNQFYLGERTGTLARQEVAGQFPTLQTIQGRWFDGDTANLSIGQGPITVTPLQMAVMTSGIANGGSIYWPRIVSMIRPSDPDAGSEKSFAQGRLRRTLTVSTKNLESVREAMLADVEDSDGTGRQARIPGLNVCGKTGTAEINTPLGRDKITWFASFAPYDKPRYVVIVMLESGASGGSSCAPVAKKIYEALLKREKQSAPQVAAN